MTDACAIILAAGLSRRMGARNKLLLAIDGVPMIRHMVNIYCQAVTGPVLVVTGHDAGNITAALGDSGAVTVFNPDYAQGQQTSVACGLRAVGDARAILVGLGDQPLLSADNLRTLLAAHAAADPARISIPMTDGARGNPIVVPGPLRARLLENPKSPGCRTFSRTNPDHVQFHQLNAPGFYADVDTPDAYDAYVARALEEAS